MKKKIRKAVNYNDDLLYYYDDEILIYVKDGNVVGSMTTGLEIMSVGIEALQDSLCWAYKKDKLEIIDGFIKNIFKIRKEIENEKEDHNNN